MANYGSVNLADLLLYSIARYPTWRNDDYGPVRVRVTSRFPSSKPSYEPHRSESTPNYMRVCLGTVDFYHTCVPGGGHRYV